MNRVRPFLELLKPGDFAVLLLGMLAVASLFLHQGQGASGQTLVVRAKGQIVAELPLNAPRTLSIAGAIGHTVVEIAQGRVRVAGDPGPRQLCVEQGWISREGEGLLCLANQVTLAIPGSAAGFDSLNY